MSDLTRSELKEAYNQGYKDGQDALAYHLELCKEEAEPCDCISFPKGTLKKRGKGYVVYNPKWLKENWQTELKVMGINAITVPEGATNGDVVKLVFPNVAIEIHFRMLDDWWNSPYRKEQE